MNEGTEDNVDPVAKGRETPKETLMQNEYENPIYFRITTKQGTRTTLLPSVGMALTEKFDSLTRTESVDYVRGGIGEDERGYLAIIFDGAAVDNPTNILKTAEGMVRSANIPLGEVSEEGKEEWRKSTIIITDIDGIDYELPEW